MNLEDHSADHHTSDGADDGGDNDVDEEDEGDEESNEEEDDMEDEEDEDENEEARGNGGDGKIIGKSMTKPKPASAAKIAVGTIVVRPRPRKPDDLYEPSAATSGLRITQQKRLGHAWEHEDGPNGKGSGPQIDLAHLAYVQEDFSRRTDAVAQLRARMTAKSRPGYELRVQRRWDCASIGRMVLRRHFAWMPCVVATMTDAVWDGDILQVHSLLLQKREFVNFRDPHSGQRALNLAIQQQHEPIVRLLMDRGADVNEPDEDPGGAKLAPLHNALIMGNKALFRRLLKVGADHEQQDGEGFTPLMWAAMRGYLEIAAQLVEAHGADVNHQDALGWTPLHIACFKGYSDVVDYLLVERHARTDIEDANGFTPFMFARIAEHRDILQRLDDYAAMLERKRLQRMKENKRKAARSGKTKKKKTTTKVVNLAQTSPKRLFVTSKN